MSKILKEYKFPKGYFKRHDFKMRTLINIANNYNKGDKFKWFNYNEYMRHDPDFRAQLSLMAQNKDTLYIIDTFTFQDRCKYDVFNSMEEGSLNNVVGAGMWFVNSPVTRTVCNRYGYTNPFEALEDTDSRVILVDNIYPDQKALFLSEHSGKAYSAEYIGTTNGFDNYRMTCAD